MFPKNVLKQIESLLTSNFDVSGKIGKVVTN